MDNLFFFGGLLLLVLFAPWILLWRSRTRQKQERAEDLDEIERLKSRTFELEGAVRELKRSFQAPTTQPAAQRSAEAATVAPPPPVKKVTEPEPTSAQITAEAWVSQKVSRPVVAHLDSATISATNPVTQTPPVEPTRASTSSVPFEPSGYVAQNSKSALDLEEMLGTNWLNKIGISILVLGIAFFLAYQIRTLGPAGKYWWGTSSPPQCLVLESGSSGMSVTEFLPVQA